MNMPNMSKLQFICNPFHTAHLFLHRSFFFLDFSVVAMTYALVELCGSDPTSDDIPSFKISLLSRDTTAFMPKVLRFIHFYMCAKL